MNVRAIPGEKLYQIWTDFSLLLQQRYRHRPVPEEEET
jgi:hypothetical protein